MSFTPEVNQEITIDGVPYRFRVHPAAPGMPYGQEGRYGMVYQLKASSSAWKRGNLTELCALKVFKPRYRAPALAGLADRIKVYAAQPGLQVCQRRVLVPQRQEKLLREFPDLTYAVLMPWIEGPTWMQVLVEKRSLIPEDSLGVARTIVEVLEGLEQQGIAHCDLSGPNIILPGLARPGAVERGPVAALVDVEQLYAPGLPAPDFLPSSSPGYAHLTAHGSLWNATADRFAGAVLIAEMLGWCDPRVRECAYGESYFDPGEMQQPSARYELLLRVLNGRWGSRAAELYKQAWESHTLADCPTFAEWRLALPEPKAKTVPRPQPVEHAPTHRLRIEPAGPQERGERAPLRRFFPARLPGWLNNVTACALMLGLGLGVLLGIGLNSESIWRFFSGETTRSTQEVEARAIAITPMPIPTRTAAPTASPVPTRTRTPTPTSSFTPTPTYSPTATMDADPLVYDNFDNPAFDGGYNTDRWFLSPQSTGDIRQKNGVISFSVAGEKGSLSLQGKVLPSLASGDPFFLEASMKLGANTGHGSIMVFALIDKNQQLRGQLARFTDFSPFRFFHVSNYQQKYNMDFGGRQAVLNRWYTLRFEAFPSQDLVVFYIDGKRVAEYRLGQGQSITGSKEIFIFTYSETDIPFTAEIDNVRYGQIP